MAERKRKRLGAPKRALIGPLVMLASGAAAGAALWRFLMLEPGPAGTIRLAAPEHLSSADRGALERFLEEHAAR